MYVIPLDFETLGLDARCCNPIEVAARVLKPGPDGPEELGRFHSLIKPGLTGIADGEPYAINMHRESGLLEKVLADGVPHLNEVDQKLTDFIHSHVDAKEKDIHLLGNTIGFDDKFVDVYFPVLRSRLHYRTCDITGVNIFIHLFTGKNPMDWKKKKAHTAESDIEETMQEASKYAEMLGLKYEGSSKTG